MSNKPDDALIQESLQLLDQDAAPMDATAIAKAVATAGDVFASSTPQPPSKTQPSMQVIRREAGAHKMLAGNRTVVMLTGCLMAAVISLAVWAPSNGDQVLLGAVLDRTLDADTVQFRVTRDGETADVWVRDSKDVRWQKSSTQYEIANGSQLWRIDENENVAAASESPWFTDGEVDVWALLGVGKGTGVRDAKPVGKQMHQGRMCNVFEIDSTRDAQTFQVMAYADSTTQRLVTLAAWERGKTRKQPPVAEVRLIARNDPIDAAQFQVPPTLTADGRIGKLGDSQGIVTLRSSLSERWTPVVREMLLKTGDWLRTDVRGANAARVDLTSSFQVTAGPGSQLQLVNPNEIKLRRGEVQIKAVKGGKSALTLTAAGGRSIQLPAKGSVIYRADKDGSLMRLKDKPTWLAGFDGSAAQESLGSLIARVDNRDVELSVSEHHVDVMIRDQIARTTITQAFHNHTNVRTEGVFHFPLPQDASIAGFAMWIGGELIEADVVEKQRAREIYETILRENRDPALLEWTGGNIFKARVFPIEAHSDKRIRITYTQVLPMRNRTYRYSYALRSELLRKNPVRELSLNVTINSAAPIRDVKCPTHEADITGVAGNVSVKWDAQEHTPERDFEVVVQTGLADHNQTVRFSKKALAVAQAELEQALEVERKRPRTIPALEIKRLRLAVAKAELAAEAASNNGAIRYLETEMKLTEAELETAKRACLANPSPQNESELEETELAWLEAKEAYAVFAGRPDATGLVVIPHQRGDDGYFLMQFAAPGSDGTWKRELIPNGDPLEVSLVCDTSASMDSVSRDSQLKFVSAVLASLGPKDRFNVAVCDVDCTWLFDKPVNVADDNTTRATDWLADRVSLGWTDLDRTFASIAKRVRKSSHVIYIGDGVVSAGDADPSAFAARVCNMYGDKSASTFHAVSVGSSFESTVLQAIASVGGGSVRQISGERTPQKVANDLLSEIAQPGLRDLKLEFKGVQVAAVYPKRLPNLAAGTQQIVIGRYLPSNDEQLGHVIVSGTRGGKSERFAAKFDVPGTAVEGRPAETNSFIPRLWARAHLDQLLAQGSSDIIKDQIISLSEEFHIMTPYTSLLVLESDADRARFKVKRRYQMRDGERFFADGRDEAKFELLQQQMRRAGDWRIALRQQVLNQLATLGRNPKAFRNNVERMKQLKDLERLVALDDRLENVTASNEYSFYFGLNRGQSSNRGLDGFMGLGEPFAIEKSLHELSPHPEPTSPFDVRAKFESERIGREFPPRSSTPQLFVKPRIMAGSEIMLSRSWDTDGRFMDPFDSDGDFIRRASLDLVGLPPSLDEMTEFIDREGRTAGRHAAGEIWNPLPSSSRYAVWVSTYFPNLAGPVIVPPKPRKSYWQPDMVKLSKRLLVADDLTKLKGGIEIHRKVEEIEPRWKRTKSITQHTELYSPTAWVSRRAGNMSDTITNFCDTEQRGVYSHAFRFGRVRDSHPNDLRPRSTGVGGYTFAAMHEWFSNYIAMATNDEAGILEVVLIPADESHTRRVITVHEERNVVLRERAYEYDKLQWTETRKDFVKASGRWWPRTIESTDSEGRVYRRTTLTYQDLDPNAFTKRYASEAAATKSVQFLRAPAPTLADAEEAIARGEAKFEHHFLLMLQAFSKQKWDDALKSFGAMEALEAHTKQGRLKWAKPLVLKSTKRNEEARQALLALIADVVGNDVRRTSKSVDSPKTTDLEVRRTVDLFLAEHIHNSIQSLGSPQESLAALDKLQPVIDRQPAHRGAKLLWDDHRIRFLNRMNGGTSIGQTTAAAEELRLREQQARVAPWSTEYQEHFAYALSRHGFRDRAYKWLRQEIDADKPWQTWESARLRDAYSDMLRNDGRIDELIAFYVEWMKDLPDNRAGYERYLGALRHANRGNEADELARRWMTESHIDGKLSAAASLKLYVAISWAVGTRHGNNTKYMPPGFDDVIEATARHFMLHHHNADTTQRILTEYRVQSSQIGDRLREEAARVLRKITDPNDPIGRTLLYDETRKDRNEAAIPALKSEVLSNLLWHVTQHRVLPNEELKAVADRIRVQHDATQNHWRRVRLAKLLHDIYSRQLTDEVLPFRRHQIALARKAGEEDEATEFTRQLFDGLIKKGTDEALDEAFSLIDKLTNSESGSDQLMSRVDALMRFVDKAVAGRIRTGQRELQDKGHPEKLTRTELAKRHANIADEARRSVAQRLLVAHANLVAQQGANNKADDDDTDNSADKATDNRDVDKQSKTTNADRVTRAFADWLQIELVHLAIQSGKDEPTLKDELTPKGFHNKAQGRAAHPGSTKPPNGKNPERVPQGAPRNVQTILWSLLNKTTPKFDVPEIPQTPKDIEKLKHARLSVHLLSRTLTLLSHLAAQPTAKKTDGERLLKYIDLAIAEGGPRAPALKSLKFKLLVVLERADDLEAALRTWIRTASGKRSGDETASMWRSQLARLMAERGKLDEAIELLETVERDSQLAQGDYMLLSDWYAATGDKANHKRAQKAAFIQMTAWSIRRWLGNQSSRWTAPNAPPVLDEQILFAFEVMLSKAGDTRDYIDTLQSYYRATRDFRLMRIAPDAVIGRSPQQVYYALERAAYRLLDEIRTEATADELLKHLRTVRAKSDSPLDRRALDLMECVVERHASKVLNQPGPHAKAAVAAMARAFEHKLTDGEPVLMAQFLDNLGDMKNRELSDLRLKQVRQLQAMTKPATEEHLEVSWILAQVLTYRHDNRRAAIEVMEAAVQAFEQVHRVWPYSANAPLFKYVGLLEDAGRYLEAEHILQRNIAGPLNAGQKSRFQVQLDRLYMNAIRYKGRVSLGEGRKLFDRLVPYFIDRIEATTDGDREGVYATLTNTFEYAAANSIPVRDPLSDFAFKRVPKLLAKQTDDYDDIVQDVADCVYKLLGDADATLFLVERMENYPQRYKHTSYSSWRQFSYRLGKWFAEARAAASQPTANDAARAEIKLLTPRVLKLTLTALRRDLTVLYGRSRNIYHDSRYFWNDKRADFARVANEVLAKHADSRRHVMRIADYFEDGLNDRSRGVEVLLIARKDGVLDPSDDGKIADWLQQLDRHGEAIALLEGLVERNPNSMNNRVSLINAYHYADRPTQRDALLADTDQHFRAEGRWTENSMVQLARLCAGIGKPREAVGYYNELIPLHERTHANRGIGNGTLSTYYRDLSDAYAKLGETKSAVDAASSAIVSWSPTHKNRTKAVDHLRYMLQSAEDLDDYIKSLDKQSAEKNQDSPLIRRVAGEAYASNKEHESAVSQFRKAIELQPFDFAAHDGLIKSLDELKHDDAAATATLELVKLDRHNLTRFEELAKRYANHNTWAERAATSIVESAPNEAENHAALAKLRESQDRLPEAIHHWKHVAKLRALEPTGLQRLASAQVKAGRLDEARQTLTKLTNREWPSRFEELPNQIEVLRKQLMD